MDAYAAIVSKRDTRSFTADPVGDDDLRRILQAGRMAGTAKNRQSNRFVVLRDQARKSELAACGQFSAWIPTAPVNIAVVMTPDGRDFDAGRAAQNMMVTAHALGLASCPVTMHDNDCARNVLGAPEGHTVAIVLAIGHPDPQDPGRMNAPRTPLDDLAFQERWGGT
ncbi:MAG TPA: nitroreductase family protein [Acidimicrobiales bacterium]|nr:nitroreductase family protein [Acidimicrobiales bacterium]